MGPIHLVSTKFIALVSDHALFCCSIMNTLSNQNRANATASISGGSDNCVACSFALILALCAGVWSFGHKTCENCASFQGLEAGENHARTMDFKSWGFLERTLVNKLHTDQRCFTELITPCAEQL